MDCKRFTNQLQIVFESIDNNVWANQRSANQMWALIWWRDWLLWHPNTCSDDQSMSRRLVWIELNWIEFNALFVLFVLSLIAKHNSLLQTLTADDYRWLPTDWSAAQDIEDLSDKDFEWVFEPSISCSFGDHMSDVCPPLQPLLCPNNRVFAWDVLSSEVRSPPKRGRREQKKWVRNETNDCRLESWQQSSDWVDWLSKSADIQYTRLEDRDQQTINDSIECPNNEKTSQVKTRSELIWSWEESHWIEWQFDR